MDIFETVTIPPCFVLTHTFDHEILMIEPPNTKVYIFFYMDSDFQFF